MQSRDARIAEIMTLTIIPKNERRVMKEYIDEVPSWAFPMINDDEYAEEHKPCLNDIVKNAKNRSFIRRNGILLCGLALLVLWTWTIATIAYHNGKVDATEQLTADYEQQIEEAVQAVREEYAAQRFTADEASRQAAMQMEATWISKVLYGIKDNNEKDLRTAVWCILNRVDSKWYPNSVQEVCEQNAQWMGFSADNPVLTDLKNIALDELEEWYSGERPVGIEYVYLFWSPTKVTLRDQFQDGSQTNYWRYGQ